jgi:SWI/SNF related-matrix-associated actin-dependent regulator of chromatin subfamily C
MYSGDFVRLDEEAFKHSSAGAGSDWSDEETLLLLEGVEMFDDDWQAVAEHVGTRSKEQCISKFLQLPIEDPYLTSDPAADLGPLRYQAGVNGLPFESAENPVMSVVAFLANAVGPAVAAAAAQSALGELAQGMKRKREGGAAGAAKKVKESSEVEGEKGTTEGEGEVKTEAIVVDGEESAPVEANGDVDDSSAPTKSSVERAASIALGAAAAKASALAQHEDRRLSTLVSRLVSAQVKKVELKLTMFERLEEVLENEKRNLEVGRQQLFREKINVQKQLENVEEMLKKAKEASDAREAVSAEEVKETKEEVVGKSTAEQVQEVKEGGMEVEGLIPSEASVVQL